MRLSQSRYRLSISTPCVSEMLPRAGAKLLVFVPKYQLRCLYDLRCQKSDRIDSTPSVLQGLARSNHSDFIQSNRTRGNKLALIESDHITILIS